VKISRVRAFLMSSPLAEPLVLPYYGGERTIVKRDAMLIRVEADNGLVGYGPGPAHEEALHGIEQIIGPFLEGRYLRDPDALRILFVQQPQATPPLVKLYAAVEVALFELTAKAFGVPLADMIGGPVREDIRLYGSAGMYMSPQGYAEEAEAIIDMGFGAYKFRPALGPEGDIEAVTLMRKAAGPDAELMVDAHSWWRMGERSYAEKTVHDMARELGRLHCTWLEEPLPPHDHAAYVRLRELDTIPIASGEHEQDDAGFADLILTRAVDFVQMDLVCQGGYTGARKLLADLARAGLPFAFHSWGTALEVLAAAHLGVCWPESVVAWLEYPCYRTITQPGMYPFPLAEEILAEPLPVSRGALTIDRTRPGLGIDINDKVIERFPWIPGPWSFFRIDAPAETWAVTGDHSLRWA
jgi:L-alanine-DL-glutamate epimerase-like enolase superfamily enzyme